MRILSAILSILVFLFIFCGGILYTFNQTKTYQAVGTLELLKAPASPYLSIDELLNTTEQESDTAPCPAELNTITLNTQLALLQSNAIIQAVEQRLQGDTRDRFMAPYLDFAVSLGPLSPMEVLQANRSIVHQPESAIYSVAYTHPDPMIAAEVSNYFMKSYIDYHLGEKIDGTMRMVEDLRIRIDQMDERMAEYESKLSKLKESSQATDSELIKFESTITREREFQSKLYTAFSEAKTRISLANSDARIIDPAFPPLRHHSPDIVGNLRKALLGGLAAGLVLFVASRQVF